MLGEPGQWSRGASQSRGALLFCTALRSPRHASRNSAAFPRRCAWQRAGRVTPSAPRRQPRRIADRACRRAEPDARHQWRWPRGHSFGPRPRSRGAHRHGLVDERLAAGHLLQRRHRGARRDVEGDWLNPVSKAGFSCLMANVKYLSDGRYTVHRIEEEATRDAVSRTTVRIRPVMSGKTSPRLQHAATSGTWEAAPGSAALQEASN